MFRTALLFCGMLAVVSCTKNREVEGRMQTVLQIVGTQSPDTVAAGQSILSKVRSVGPNLCYRFEQMEAHATGTREYAVRSIGSIPIGDAVCAEALFTIDTTVTIPTAQPGDYILRFYNGPTLFKADTVVVQ